MKVKTNGDKVQVFKFEKTENVTFEKETYSLS